MTTTKVFVGSLPPGCKPEELRHLFTNFGIVIECDVMNRCGFVHMETIDMADTAIAALNGSDFKGQQIVVEPGRPKDNKAITGGPGNRRPMRGPPGNINRAVGGPMSGSQRPPRREPILPNIDNQGRSSDNNMNNVGGGGGNFMHNRRGSGSNNNFGGPSRRPNFSNIGGGPIRNDNGSKQQRSAPYRGPHNNVANQDRRGSNFRSKFDGVGNSFGNSGPNSQAPNFNQPPSGNSGGRFSGNYNIPPNNFDNNSSSNNGNANVPTKRGYNRNNFSGGYSGNMSTSGSNDFHIGSGNSGNGRGPSNIQDRRGFALPASDHLQQPQQLQFGAPQKRFSNTALQQGNGNDNDNRNFQRRNNTQMNLAPNHNTRFGGVGGFGGGIGSETKNVNSYSENRVSGGGGPNNRSNFNARRSCGSGGGSGGGDIAYNANQQHPQQNRNFNFRNDGSTSYQKEFPPLGASSGGPRGGGMAPRNGPRQNPMPNRRY